MKLTDKYKRTTLTTEIKAELATPVGRLIFVNRYDDIYHSIDLDIHQLDLLRKELTRIIQELKIKP